MEWGRMANTTLRARHFAAVRQSGVMNSTSTSVSGAVACCAASRWALRPRMALRTPLRATSPMDGPRIRRFAPSRALSTWHASRWGRLCPRSADRPGRRRRGRAAAGEQREHAPRLPGAMDRLRRDPAATRAPGRRTTPIDIRFPARRSACVVSGYDLDRTDEQQRRGARLRQVGHGAVDLIEPRGTPVHLVGARAPGGSRRGRLRRAALRHHRGHAPHRPRSRPAAGLSRALRTSRIGLAWHRHRRGPRARATSSAAWATPARLDACTCTSRRGACATGSTPTKLAPSSLANGVSSIVCDPRNVLPLR